MKSVSIALGILFLVLHFQNCGRIGFQSQPDQTSASLSTQSSKLSCQFIGVDSIRFRLMNIFGLPQADVAILNDSGMPTSVMRVEKSKAELGEGDPSKSLSESLSCGMSKYKISAEIFIDACAWSMEKHNGEQRLFPNGLHRYEDIYLLLVGRHPTTYEVQQLEELAPLLPEAKRAVGLCAAVATSLESLIQI